MFQNRVLREIFEPEMQEVAGDWIKLYIMRRFMIGAAHQMLLG
jgi:hypothetical protein